MRSPEEKINKIDECFREKPFFFIFYQKNILW
jgi:hypothetical protein